MTEVGVARGSAVRLVLRTPLFRGATAAVLLSGIGLSSATPLMALFLVEELHASLSAAGLFALTNLTAPIAGYLVGARSDRVGDRLGLFRVCAVLGFAGWAIIAVSHQLWIPVVVTAVVLAFAGAATSQLFAAVQDSDEPGLDGVVAIVRMALVAGWVVGPVLGSLLAAWIGVRPMFLVTAVCLLLQMAPLGRQRTAAHDHQDREVRPGPGLRRLLPLLAFTALTVLLYSGDTVKFAYLPLYMTRDLALPAGLRGAIIGIQPVVELLTIPAAMALARRFGERPPLIAAGLLGAAGSTCFAVFDTAAGLFAGQILIGFLWGTFGGLGILLAQRLLPSAVATASAVFVSAEPVSAAVGGLASGLSVEPLGIHHVFLVPAALALAATLGLVAMGVRRPAP